MVMFDLAHLSQLVAADLAEGGPSDASFTAARMIGTLPDATLALARHVLEHSEKPATKGKRRKAAALDVDGQSLQAAHAFLLTTAIEELRFGVEARRAEALVRADRLRAYLLEAATNPRVDPAALTSILQAFALAKLDIGEPLREAMPRLIENTALSVGPDAPGMDLAAQFADIAEELGDDPFVIHAMVDGIVQTLPEEMRAVIAASVASQDNAPMREAVLGWLLADSAVVRRAAMGALAKSAEAGAMSGVALRRMIALRNWLPEGERAELDGAIKAGQKKTGCASWPVAKVLQVFSTGIDSAGAQSVLIITAEGRKRAFASLLLKHGIGVRDAFAQHDLTKKQTEQLLGEIVGEMPLAPMEAEAVGPLVRHHLGANARSGVLPPFGLLDVAEAVGLADLNPRYRGLDELVAELCAAALEPDDVEPDSVTGIVRGDTDWTLDEPIIGSWFEDTDEAAALFSGKKLSAAKRKAALMTALQKRRRWWAELIAWTAWNIKHRQSGGGWEPYAIVARELLGERPIEEFGIMRMIADATRDFHRQ